MRKVESTQVELGGVFIGDIVIDAKSRDDIPALLRGLKHNYVNPAIQTKVFALLEVEVNPRARKDSGRPGMDLWRILVLAILKQGLNCDHDRLAELANEHGTLRQMLGHGLMEHHYKRQTIVDNDRLAEPAVAGQYQPAAS